MLTFLLLGCSQPKPEFAEWYAKHKGPKTGEYDASKLREISVRSDTFRIDSIYMSMHGPESYREFTAAGDDDLIWVVGYSVKVKAVSTGEESDIDFMCHNNIRTNNPYLYPWGPGGVDYYNRFFTLTQGYESASLPEGFGIPIPGSEVFHVDFQALNLNYAPIDTLVVQEVVLKYFLDSEIDFPIKPLMFHPIWVRMKYAGPPGDFGDPIPDIVSNQSMANRELFSNVQQPSCGIEMLASGDDSRYFDDYGRIFTGHWKMPPGEELLVYDMTKMLGLKENRTLHKLIPHVHAHCEYIEVIDLTANDTIIRCEMESFSHKHGLKKIEDFTSAEGVVFDKSHKYQFVSYYNNTTPDTITAMSVIHLFFAM